MRAVLDDARAARPGRVVTCISFYTLQDGRQVARIGADPVMIDDSSASRTARRLRAKDVLVLSVNVSETTFEDVQSLTHVLVARVAIPRKLRNSPYRQNA
jgi:hypothetical protein